MKTCVINFARGGWYERGQDRLARSLEATGFDGDMLLFNDEHQLPGCPTHQVSPYAFKPFALKAAVDRGYELVIWADASVWAIKNIKPMFEHIEREGWMFFLNTCTGNWTSDACLKSFGVTRDQAMDIPMLMGICMGWNMTLLRCQSFLDVWLEKAVDGVTFPGSWTNKHQEVSADPRVYGHRHDQSAASIMAYQMAMPLIVPHETYFEYYRNLRGTPFDGDLSQVRHHTVMIAQGM